uniref:Uncharacterized protein n=1 Tax=Ditylenchus dipsaci TaxID=166011 RepID=A0A915EIX5_9BILA
MRNSEKEFLLGIVSCPLQNIFRHFSAKGRSRASRSYEIVFDPPWSNLLPSQRTAVLHLNPKLKKFWTRLRKKVIHPSCTDREYLLLLPSADNTEYLVNYHGRFSIVSGVHLSCKGSIVSPCTIRKIIWNEAFVPYEQYDGHSLFLLVYVSDATILEVVWVDGQKWLFYFGRIVHVASRLWVIRSSSSEGNIVITCQTSRLKTGMGRTSKNDVFFLLKSANSSSRTKFDVRETIQGSN